MLQLGLKKKKKSHIYHSISINSKYKEFSIAECLSTSKLCKTTQSKGKGSFGFSIKALFSCSEGNQQNWPDNFKADH